MPEVIVRPGAPDEYTIPFTYGWEQRRIVGRMRRLKIDVDREEARAADLNPKTDRVELTGVDTVLLVDVKTGGSTWTLVCYSAEWLANRAGYTAGGNVREGTDGDLVTALVGEVAGWTAGDISTFSGPLSFVFSHALRHEALRRIEPNVPGELRFRDFGTVDYVDRLGSDKTGSVELSAGAGTIEDRIQITERNRQLSGTHLRVLGAHEGEAQLSTNLIPEDDTDAQAEYDNVVTYQTPRWTEEADTDWDRWSNNDITDQATLESEAAELGEELGDALVTVETTVPTSVGLSVGDTVRVVKADADLDREMRVHKQWRRAGTRNDTDSNAAVVDKVELSTRTTLQTESDADLEELRKFNTGFQGASVWATPTGGVQAVDNGVNYFLSFFYPEVAFENKVELQIKSIPYRAYFSDVGIQKGETLAIIETPDLDTNEFLEPGQSATISTDIGTDFSDYVAFVELEVNSDADETDLIGIDADGSGTTPTLVGTFSPDGIGNLDFQLPDPNVSSGDTYSLTIENRNPSSGDPFTVEGSSGFNIYDPNHSHDADPGVTEIPDATATNVDVLVNGSEVATNVNSGIFESVVDLKGELAPGQWNTIEVSSTTAGLMLCTLGVDAYRQIGRTS